MKNKILLFGTIATAVVLFLKNKAKAFELSQIKLEAFKITGFDGTNLNSTLTVSIQNPTPTDLEFNSISGKVYEGTKLLSTFDRSLKTNIPANKTTKFDIALAISVTSIVQSALDLIANGINTSFTIDSVTNVSGINIPVRQTFNINFAKATNETVTELQNGPGTTDSGLVDVNTTVSNATPTLVAPQVLDPNISTPNVATANYDGSLDPTGGVVITLPAPDALLFSTSNDMPFVAVDDSIYLNPNYSGVVNIGI
jgi:LEA14-like dessication related protein